MADWKPGDVVVLKSGGPPMTVERIARDSQQRPMVCTQWFKDDLVQDGVFSPDSLKSGE